MTQKTNSIRNIGILAHVDAGKTTLTEQMLFASGEIRSLGSVDKGTSTTDSMSIERERGISVRAAATALSWCESRINIIDTPGHIDFSAEVERALLALDGAVLVVSAVEGVQGHTISLFQALKSLGIPCLIFINKLDRVGADVANVIEEIKNELTVDCLLLQTAENEGTENANFNSFWNEKFIDNKNKSINADSNLQTIIESIVEKDETLLEYFLDEKPLSFTLLNAVLKKQVAICQQIPVFLGVAKKSFGINELLHAIVEYLPAAPCKSDSPVSAIVYKIEYDKSLGKIVHLRLFSGLIKARDPLFNNRLKKEEKISQIKKIQKGKQTNAAYLSAGDIGLCLGLSEARVGDIYGELGEIAEDFQFSSPLLSVKASPDNPAQIGELTHALQQLSEEDPSLDLEWLPVQRELHLKISGKIQIEVLQASLLQRFDLKASFSPPNIIYKETPLKSAFGFERYWMPKPCWAILKLKIEPGELGSGVQYESQLSKNSIAAKYQNEIESIMPKALAQGIKGWQVTDIKITLVDGEDHNVHTRPGDYLIATPMAIMNGLKEAGTGLLEPILAFSISAELDLLGDITSDITKMRGSFDSPQINGNRFTLKGKVPAATSLEYPIQLASLSGGKAKLTTKLAAYEPCTLEQGEITEYRGVSPLDREKWILQARGAIKS